MPKEQPKKPEYCNDPDKVEQFRIEYEERCKGIDKKTGKPTGCKVYTKVIELDGEGNDTENVVIYKGAKTRSRVRSLRLRACGCGCGTRSTAQSQKFKR